MYLYTPLLLSIQVMSATPPSKAIEALCPMYVFTRTEFVLLQNNGQ